MGQYEIVKLEKALELNGEVICNNLLSSFVPSSWIIDFIPLCPPSPDATFLILVLNIYYLSK